MSLDFEELDYRQTRLGELILRRRRDPLLGGPAIYEVKLNDEYLMSSAFTAGETALADLGLGALTGPEAGPCAGAVTALDVLVAGLGLGYTAAAALRHEGVRSLLVVDALAEVIEWHERALIPLGAELAADPRCRFAQADFFSCVRGQGFDPATSGQRYHAILLDIDHSPGHWLNPANAGFYESRGLSDLERHLHPGGVFAMWSNDEPDGEFLVRLTGTFARACAHPVEFDNPYTGNDASCTIYVAHTARR
ncbi:MAG: spermidine synthase [Gammaproteobacteria bacterium]